MFTCYQPRPTQFLGIETVRGFRLKTYSICAAGLAFDRARFDPSLSLVQRALPDVAVTSARPGVGLVILHQGETGDYVVLAWWDRENELPVRVFVREGVDWREAKADESFCVWDLRVMWFEREAYVRTVLSQNGGGVEAYLEAIELPA